MILTLITLVFDKIFPFQMLTTVHIIYTILLRYVLIYTGQNYKRNTFVFAPIFFHELNSRI